MSQEMLTQNQKHMSIAQYIHRQQILLNTPFIIKPDGTGVFLFKGKEYSRMQFRLKFPMPITLTKFNGGEIDPDPRRVWLKP